MMKKMPGAYNKISTEILNFFPNPKNVFENKDEIDE